MQLMTATYGDVRRRNPELGDINDPEWNIAAGIWYSREQWNYWEEEAEKSFHREFMLGSYNAGRAILIRAQQLALAQKLNHRRWPSIERVAPKVPNWRYKETLAYVESVFTNLAGMDRKGRVKGPTISTQDHDGIGLQDQLKRVAGLLKRLGRRGD